GGGGGALAAASAAQPGYGLVVVGDSCRVGDGKGIEPVGGVGPLVGVGVSVCSGVVSLSDDEPGRGLGQNGDPVAHHALDRVAGAGQQLVGDRSRLCDVG